MTGLRFNINIYSSPFCTVMRRVLQCFWLRLSDTSKVLPSQRSHPRLFTLPRNSHLDAFEELFLKNVKLELQFKDDEIERGSQQNVSIKEKVWAKEKVLFQTSRAFVNTVWPNRHSFDLKKTNYLELEISLNLYNSQAKQSQHLKRQRKKFRRLFQNWLHIWIFE